MANGHFGGGDGTKENPFLIEDGYDLLAITGDYEDDFSPDDYEEGDDSYIKYYRQVKDIDLKDIPFTPMFLFRSVYDGGGYKIKNLYIYGEEREGDYYGLFSFVFDCVLTNIHIVNAHIYIQLHEDYYSNSIYGILSARVDKSLIENCSVTGKVETSITEYWSIAEGGGLIGVIDSSTLKTSYADVSLHTRYAGGLVHTVAYSEIQDCYVKGSIHNAYEAGTLALTFFDGNKIKNCYGVVKMVDVEVHYPLGDIIAELEDDAIASCYIDGEYSVPEWDETKKYRKGALVRGTDGAFYRCIEGQENRDFDIDTSTIDFPEEWHDISELEPLYPRFTRAQPVTGELWATHWELCNDDSISTTSLMKQKDTFVGWDFATIWGIEENETYPFFHLRQPIIEIKQIKCKSLTLSKRLVQ